MCTWTKLLDTLLNLQIFQHASSIDLNMGYYNIWLDETSQKIIFPINGYRKYSYIRFQMGTSESVDILNKRISECLVGNVKCCNISKFCDTNIDTQYVKKAQKVPNIRVKSRYFWTWSFFICTMYSSHSKDFKNAIKIKNNIFAPGHGLVHPTYDDFPKIDVATNYNVRIFWHFSLSYFWWFTMTIWFKDKTSKKICYCECSNIFKWIKLMEKYPNWISI